MSIADKLTLIAENQQKVYDAGKKAEYDRFWDAFQLNGERRLYEFGFCGAGWTDETFVPKYDIITTGNANNMFGSTRIEDLSAALQNAGVTLKTGTATRVDTMFYYSTLLTKVPELDVRGVTYSNGLNNMFASCVKLQTIEKLILPADRYITANNTAFSNCKALENIVIEGKIGTNGWNFNSCPLSVASMKNIISCLVDLTGTAGEGAYTIKFNSTCWTNLEADSTAPDGGTWKRYVASLGWLI